MFASLAFAFLFGMLGAAVFERMHLPRMIGMLLVGILIGPYALGLLDSSILAISGDLRKLALMLILLSLKSRRLCCLRRPFWGLPIRKRRSWVRCWARCLRRSLCRAWCG